MPNNRIIRQSFVGGEISRELFGRIDLANVQSGLDTCQNFIVNPWGTVSNRPGTQYVYPTKNSNNISRLISFSFSDTQTFAIEMGAGYFRFFSNGGVLLSAGIPYEVSNAYAQADLFAINYVQSGDIITLVHPLYPPKELKRITNLNWTFTDIVFASSMPAPGGVNATANYPTAGVTRSFKYVVTALNALGYEESPASTPTTPINNDLTIQGNYNVITWSAVSGAIRYNIYKYAGGTYGYIGQVNALTFTDDNILADLTHTIPINDTIFSSVGNYPSAVCYYEQRRFFSSTINEPLNIWGTQSASPTNMSYSIPSQSSDALRFKIAAQRNNNIRFMIPALDMLVLTSSTEWRVFSSSSDALSPSTISIKAQAQNGTAAVQPVTVGNYIIYSQAQGGHFREMSYQWQSSGYISSDLSLVAPHLFNNVTIKDMAFSRAPTPIIWAISSNNQLLGLTYVPDQKVSAWHKHTTVNGIFESVCTVTENNSDVLYMIVNRVINGVTKRYIEMLHTRIYTDPFDAFFVDCGLTYNGALATTISGLSHLEGQTVSCLGDGAVMPQQVVNGGKITLPVAVSKAHIGLPIIADMITPPAISQGDPTFGQSRVKNINKVWVRVYNSGEFFAGPNSTRLTPFKIRSFENPGSPPNYQTGELQLVVSPQINQDGSLMVRQSNPLPLTVVNVTLDVNIGG